MSKAEKLIAKGRALEQKGKLERALDVFREATKLDPIDPEAWQARGELAARIGAPREAAESLFRVSDMYARAGMPREALKVIIRVLELDPQHEGARRFRRMLESKSGAMEAALAPPEGADAPVVAAGSAVTVGSAVALGSAVTARPAEAVPRAESEGPSMTIEMVADEPDPMEVFDPSSSAPTVLPRSTAPFEGAAPEGSLAASLEAALSGPTPEAPPAAVVATDPASASPSASALLHTVPDGGVVAEFSIGRTTGEMALESTISLHDRLGSSQMAVGHTEIALDDEPKFDIVHAVASAIGSSPLLSELDSDLVKHLIDAGTLTRRAPGEAVFRQGDVGTSLFLILAGEVAVVREVHDEIPRELARLRAGAFFGEMALITNSPRSASVRALTAADLLEVSRKDVRGLIDKEPRVLKLLMRFFRARLVGTLLQTSPVFEPFSRDDRKKLVAAFKLRELGAGHAVFEEGSRAEGLFVLLAGRLEVLKGLDKVLGQLLPGDVFGEMSLLDGSVAMATVRAKPRSWVLLLPRAGFEDLASRYPQIRGQLRALAETRRARNERELASPGPPSAPREGRVEPI